MIYFCFWTIFSNTLLFLIKSKFSVYVPPRGQDFGRLLLWLQVSKTLLFRRLPQPPFVADTLSCFCILDTTRSRVPLAYSFITFCLSTTIAPFFLYIYFIHFFFPEALTIKAILARFARRRLFWISSIRYHCVSALDFPN